jgi:hypothetical protein
MPLRPLQFVLYRHPLSGTLVVFAAFLAIFISGAIFLPVGSGADEGAHYVYAAAVVRGQAGILEPTLPARIANIHSFATCIAFQPDVTAACQGALRSTATGEVLTQTNAGLYNPVFYAWTGLGSLLLPTEYGLYISRALAAVLPAAFFAWTLSFLARISRSLVPLAATALILTPMTLYVGMVLNPSSWEISTLFATTVGAFSVATQRAASRWTEAHTLLLVSGCFLIVTRGLSPLFFALTALVVLIAAGLSATRHLLADRRFWITVGTFAVVTAASVAWVILHGTNYVGVVRPATLADGIAGISIFYSEFHNQLAQMYGNLGWLDMPSPRVLSSAWVFFLGGLLVTAFAFARGRHRVAIALAFAVATLTPGILAGLQWSGAGWQGRYTLPLVAALLMIAALCIDADVADAAGPQESLIRRWETALSWLLPSFFALGAVLVAILAGHRYLTGDTAPLTAPWQWAPPLSLTILAPVFAIGVTVVAFSLTGRRSAR